MELVSTPLAIVLIVGGTAALGTAAWIAVRDPLPGRGPGGGRLSLLVPWAASALVVVLLVRGAFAGAAFLGLATLLHAVVTRGLASRGR